MSDFESTQTPLPDPWVYPEPSPRPDRGVPSYPPVEIDDWPERPEGWPDLDLPDEPVDRATVASRAAAVGAVVGAIVTALVLGIVVWVAGDGEADVAAPDTTSVPTTTPGPVPAGALDIQAVLTKVEPSVVSIQGTFGTSAFGGSAGSGVILSADGLILTNAHVVQGLQQIDVRFHDGSTSEASVVGAIASEDLALIQAQGVTDLVPAELGSSADLQVGDDVVAIGNALNLGGEPTVTKGIVSAKNRIIPLDDDVTLTGLIQTDAAVNPGNSGGPLVNRAGQVIGINTAGFQVDNVSFAIAIDVAGPVIEELRDGAGEVSANDAVLGAFGSDVADLTADSRESFQVEVDSGGFVTDVEEGSPADDAGLELADVIVAIDGEETTRWADVEAVIRSRDPGDEIELSVTRFGDELSLRATLDRRGG